jgi:hypothetical protein
VDLVDKYVEFPFELDLTPYCQQDPLHPNQKYVYRLNGVVVHSGGKRTCSCNLVTRRFERWTLHCLHTKATERERG